MLQNSNDQVTDERIVISDENRSGSALLDWLHIILLLAAISTILRWILPSGGKAALALPLTGLPSN